MSSPIFRGKPVEHGNGIMGLRVSSFTKTDSGFVLYNIEVAPIASPGDSDV